jgi:hypothetical protein
VRVILTGEPIGERLVEVRLGDESPSTRGSRRVGARAAVPELRRRASPLAALAREYLTTTRAQPLG